MAMGLNAIIILNILLIIILFQPAFSIEHLLAHKFNGSPKEYIEVSKPLFQHPPRKKPCSVQVLKHDFGNTYGQPPVKVPYNPPTKCPHNWDKVVLQWRATCKGEQYDRIAGVWLSGAEILRTSTAEPTESGIVWEVNKDITRYTSLLKKPQFLAVMLENLVDSTFTGIYHVTISFHYYQIDDAQMQPSHEPADLVLPISNPFGNGGHWFKLQNTYDVQSQELNIPSNVYRAVIEIYVSAHVNDEFWYSNPPDAYIEINNLTTKRGNGAFREIVGFIDGVVVGAVWPFPVVFTGGINPLFWAPVVGIGAFDLPTYDLEVTPFVGQLLDGEHHTFGLGVTDAIAAWFVDANLHLWLDEKSTKTKGMLMDYEAPSFQPILVSNFEGLDGSFETHGERKIAFSGWVESTKGNLTTHVSQTFKYSNVITYENKGEDKKVRLKIQTNRKLTIETPSELVLSHKMSRLYPFFMNSVSLDKENGTYLATTNISHAFIEETSNSLPSGTSFTSLNNSQYAQGSMLVKDHSVLSGTASTQQIYKYRGRHGCYFRTLNVKDYKFIKDYSDNFCNYYS
ncbi:hypothetical protein SUGI_0845180 [Cryptomeria japonica]|nr:hypothetical protein SUGI_0845180 [Cryptomeria japonica]